MSEWVHLLKSRAGDKRTRQLVLAYAALNNAWFQMVNPISLPSLRLHIHSMPEKPLQPTADATPDKRTYHRETNPRRLVMSAVTLRVSVCVCAGVFLSLCRCASVCLSVCRHYVCVLCV